MVGITELITGGAALLGFGAAKSDRDAAERSAETAQRQRQESQDFIEKTIKQARGDLFKLFPSAQESLQTGIQAGLDVFNQAIPAQLQAFQGGNVGAQNQLIQGLSQQQNAILGQPIDFNPQALELGLPNIQGNVPDFGSISDLGLQAQGPLEAGGGAAVTSGALIPHKDHFHTPDGAKVGAGAAAQTFAPQPTQPAAGLDQTQIQQGLQGIDPVLAQQLIAEFQASQQGAV
jgi:hypothetical protein